ncbi:MAG TPA: glycosyltransferase [Chitinophagaceae bacterium]|jgi:glycosyltransferase involved in cell wall biosynthesis
MESRPDTLVVLTPAFPRDESDSTWVPSQQLFVKTLKASFPQLKVVVLSFFYPDHTSTYFWNDAEVIAFDGMRRRKLQRILLWKDTWKKLKALHRENNIQGIFSFWCGECALIGSWFGRRYHIRHRCWICGQDARKTNKLVKFIRPRPVELVAMSAFLADEFYRNHGIRPQYIIHNAIDPQLFPPAPAERDIDILGVGSLMPLKRYELLVEAVHALQQSLPAIRVIHCGEGEDREKLQALIARYQLENNLSLTGKQSHPDILQLMQRTKVLLHPSSYEGFSTVCLEALYAGAHVVSFCDPVEPHTPHWHIVTTLEEMTRKTLELLQNTGTEYTPVLLHSMDKTVQSVMQLFER